MKNVSYYVVYRCADSAKNLMLVTSSRATLKAAIIQLIEDGVFWYTVPYSEDENDRNLQIRSFQEGWTNAGMNYVLKHIGNCFVDKINDGEIRTAGVLL